jgi:hypothetical protein
MTGKQAFHPRLQEDCYMINFLEMTGPAPALSGQNMYRILLSIGK